MKKFFFVSLAFVGLGSPAFAVAHNGAPAGASWLQLLWIEVECLFETSLFVLGLIAEGNWLLLANLEGICTTTANSVLFSDPYTAVVTALSLTMLTIALAFLVLRRLMQPIVSTPRLAYAT